MGSCNRNSYWLSLTLDKIPTYTCIGLYLGITIGSVKLQYSWGNLNEWKLQIKITLEEK